MCLYSTLVAELDFGERYLAFCSWRAVRFIRTQLALTDTEQELARAVRIVFPTLEFRAGVKKSDDCSIRNDGFEQNADPVSEFCQAEIMNTATTAPAAPINILSSIDFSSIADGQLRYAVR